MDAATKNGLGNEDAIRNKYPWMFEGLQKNQKEELEDAKRAWETLKFKVHLLYETKLLKEIHPLDAPNHHIEDDLTTTTSTWLARIEETGRLDDINAEHQRVMAEQRVIRDVG